MEKGSESGGIERCGNEGTLELGKGESTLCTLLDPSNPNQIPCPDPGYESDHDHIMSDPK